MNDDSNISIYLNYTYWQNLSYQEKKWVLYHELLHDCFNTEHSHSNYDIMGSFLPAHLEDDPDNLINKYTKQLKIKMNF